MDKKSLKLKLDLSGIKIPTMEELIERECRRTLTVLEDSIEFRGISCIDADGKEFEKYARLLVPKDIFRNPQGQQLNFTPYDAAVYCEQQGLFLPSFALTCNILAALFKNKNDEEINKLLQQYKTHGAGYGYHAQNTSINFGTEEVIHYPSTADFNQTKKVNTGCQRTALKFSKATLHSSMLEEALRNKAQTRYVRQLTGLRELSVLVKIGKYFGKPTRLWFPWDGPNGASYNNMRAAWLGCGSSDFYLSAYYRLNFNYAARGVRR